MKVTPMIKITDIQKQVVDGKHSNLKPYFKDAADTAFNSGERITDSDFECFKDELEGYGIYVTWGAIAKFFDVTF